MARTLEELDAAVASLEAANLVDRFGLLETSVNALSAAVSQLSSRTTSLAARVNQIDGQGLADPERSSLNAFTQELAGLTTTIHQVTLVLQAEMEAIKTEHAALKGLVNAHLGV